MAKQLLELKENEHVKIEITQLVDGTVLCNANGKDRIGLDQVVGIIERAKFQLLYSQDEDMVEIELDELDIQLNPDAGLKAGEKSQIPASMVPLRDAARAEAMKSPKLEKVED